MGSLQKMKTPTTMVVVVVLRRTAFFADLDLIARLRVLEIRLRRVRLLPARRGILAMTSLLLSFRNLLMAREEMVRLKSSLKELSMMSLALSERLNWKMMNHLLCTDS